MGSTKIKRPKVLGYSVYLGEIQEFTTALLTSLSKLKVHAGVRYTFRYNIRDDVGRSALSGEDCYVEECFCCRSQVCIQWACQSAAYVREPEVFGHEEKWR